MELAALFEYSLAFDAQADWIAHLPAGGGVYLLSGDDDRVIQLATSADLKRALRHRLTPDECAPTPGPFPAERGRGEDCAAERAREEAGSAEQGRGATASAERASGEGITSNDEPMTAGFIQKVARPRLNLREVVRRIWWRSAYSQFELAWEYYRLARVLTPQSYRKQLGFGPSWFVQLDPAARTPQFVAGKLLRSPPGIDLGPFATQADAARFIDTLVDTFDLCRYQHILEQAPLGQACAYFEMGKCPAPCDGSIPLEIYRESIAAALGFALGERELTYARLTTAMREAASAQSYERAAVLKKQIERARGIEHAAFSRVRRMQEFNYLVVQRGAGTTRLRVFCVHEGVISLAGEVKRTQVADTLPRWIEQLRQPAPAAPIDARSEQIWLVSHFLFKPDTPGIYLHISELSDREQVLQRVQERFARTPRSVQERERASGQPGRQNEQEATEETESL